MATTSQMTALDQCLEGMELQLDVEEGQGLKMAQCTLVGKILSEKSLNKEAKEARRVLEEGPWFVIGHLLSLQNWLPEVSVYEVNYDLVGFWVQLHGLPLDLLSTNNAVKVAKLLGEVVYVENPVVEGTLLRSFIRVRVLINIKKTLVTGFWLPRKDFPKTWIFLKYEHLQGFCFSCGVMSHEAKRCKGEKLMAIFAPNAPRYGPSLGVAPAKSLVSIAMENSIRRKKLKEGDTTDVSQTNVGGPPDTGSTDARHAEKEKAVPAANPTAGRQCVHTDTNHGDNTTVSLTKEGYQSFSDAEAGCVFAGIVLAQQQHLAPSKDNRAFHIRDKGTTKEAQPNIDTQPPPL
ncbi:Zinc knuckle CX2CX4HX4C [Sesbania bispinosa]|nr:Zinc knuckle CX2CX4HX4C [Sesbania bispinosa]